MNWRIRILALATAATGLCVSGLADLQPGTAIVRGIVGTATYVNDAGAEKPLAVGVVLKEGDTVKTAADARLDLLLPQNGPDVELGPKSTLKFTKLRYRETEVGIVKQTILDVPEGQIFGHVSKLIGDSKYLVRSPKGIAEVKGTDFWYDTRTGNVHVLTGQVFLTVIFDVTTVIDDPPFGGDPSTKSFAKAVTINAGQSFFMPRGQLKGTTLTAVTTPPSLVIGRFFTHYTSGSSTSLVTTSYDTTLSIAPRDQFSRAVVGFPPTLVTVSP